MDKSRIVSALSRPAQMLGVLPELSRIRPQFELHLFDTLPSTNQHAWHMVDQGAPTGTVVIAQQQSAGKGQWGRRWVSAPGGLYLSLVLEPDCAIADSSLLTLTSAWGIAIALENLGIVLELKWPNDLVNGRKKLGGILVETRLGASDVGALSDPVNPNIRMAVVGVGINWYNPLPPHACSLVSLLPDSPIEGLKTLEDLAAIVLRGILQGYHYWQHQGTRKFIEVYQKKLSNLGQTITVDGNTAQVLGVSFAGDLAVGSCQTEQPQIHTLRPGEIRLGYNE